jgi:hypothetical protein
MIFQSSVRTYESYRMRFVPVNVEMSSNGRKLGGCHAQSALADDLSCGGVGVATQHILIQQARRPPGAESN